MKIQKLWCGNLKTPRLKTLAGLVFLLFTPFLGAISLPGELSDQCKVDWGNNIIISNRQGVDENPGKKFPTKQIIRSSIVNTKCFTTDQKNRLLFRLDELSEPLPSEAAKCTFFQTSNMEPTHLTVAYLIHTLKSLKNPPHRGNDNTEVATWMAHRWLSALLSKEKALLDFHPKAPLNGCDRLMQIARDITHAMKQYIRSHITLKGESKENQPKESISL